MARCLQSALDNRLKLICGHVGQVSNLTRLPDLFAIHKQAGNLRLTHCRATAADGCLFAIANLRASSSSLSVDATSTPLTSVGRRGLTQVGIKEEAERTA